MLHLKPIPEAEASEEIIPVYRSIKEILATQSVPLVFQYLACFPLYLFYIWNQAQQNLIDINFQTEAKELLIFSQASINEIYSPSAAAQMFLGKIGERAEKHELGKFVLDVSRMNASLYLLSLAIRESLKGKYLGIKQIGERLEEKEKEIFSDLSEGLMDKINLERENMIQSEIGKQIVPRDKQGITLSIFAEFFKFMNWEMETLVKREEYLTRRVELERFALNKLPLIPHPLDSSFAIVANQHARDPKFPELIYLIAELFPTQAPYKLLASAVMKKALSWQNYNYGKQNSLIG